MKCPICTANTDTFADQKHNITYHRCAQCGYICKDPVHHQNLNAQKKRYDLHRNDPDDPGYRAYFQRFLDFVLPQVGLGGRVLDFGCGASGLLGEMLEEHGFEASRYDPVYYPDEGYRQMSFDLIVSTEVFEHLDDPLEVLHHLSGMLSPGGYIAIQTQFYPPETNKFLDWYYRLDPTHIGFFSLSTFRLMAHLSDLNYLSDDGINKVILEYQ
jgi:2-polyprenyl-3-methyl-5-hydroxy-6-metoxy-1,4-benzoquinol methylase